MLQQLESLQTIAENPLRRLSELQLLPPDERHRVLVEWNDTRTEYPRDRTLHDLFASQALRTPAAVAVEYGADCVAYGELERRANRLAHRLQKLGVGPDDRVGIFVEFVRWWWVSGDPQGGWRLRALGPELSCGAVVFMSRRAARACF